MQSLQFDVGRDGQLPHAGLLSGDGVILQIPKVTELSGQCQLYFLRSFPPAQREAHLGQVRPVRGQDDGGGEPVQRVLRGGHFLNFNLFFYFLL